MDPEFDDRLHAVERALTDSDRTPESLPEAAALAEQVAEFDERLEDLESRVEELDAGLRAVRGYVGNVRHVNREVERTAEAALAKARALDEGSGPLPPERPPTEGPDEETEARTESDDDDVFDRVRGLL